MTISITHDLAELRNLLSTTDPSILLILADIEDDVMELHRRLIDIEEDNLRLKGIVLALGTEQAQASVLPKPRAKRPASRE
jgi:hypothetical protein